ncbi:MAG: hypothetical protein ACJ0SL_05565 [Candidatus Rariloculaceae bacterium]
MGFLSWLESTAYSEWIVSGLTGWPLMLSMHAVGLALIVGMMFTLNLRVFGYFKPIPFTALGGLMGIGWVGIALNIFSGLSLFMAQATFYITSPPFIVKITFIILGIANLHYMQKVLKREGIDWDAAGAAPQLGVILAASSLVFWTIGVVAGRLIAYL